ncbi:DeoR/GlpR family DNA-binding transcription regulator [Echinicola jeungdonensis]|uniref:DeoR/GlpR family DNA-binding transcription regulator n=1 Tax=Echinicola jeungdonensis TaxID=709343 RepID=A0ABV5J6B8_9BACT|nr:DeoR/GlpR family DNA-binding transcription regulator [Echinicola jeungdonensis]MDN3669819.1 DeoR/GlpR family DNA-binding transcription regulator [Echinicola jeungdonensis]
MKKTAQRRSRILEILEEKGQVNVFELSRSMGVSEVTIRNDLSNLERNKMLIRAHGGAFKPRSLNLPVSDKRKINLEKKRQIGKKAISQIAEKDSIILDSGSTTYEISKNLGGFNALKVISNSLDIIHQLAGFEQLEVLVPGGFLRDFSMSLVGPMAIRNFKQLDCQKLFLGVDGVKADVGFFTQQIEEAYLNQIMIEVAQEVIVVADSSKFNKSSLAFIAGFDKINKVITDAEIEHHQSKMLERNDVELIVAD